jgi:hypothetical protein
MWVTVEVRKLVPVFILKQKAPQVESKGKFDLVLN